MKWYEWLGIGALGLFILSMIVGIALGIYIALIALDKGIDHINKYGVKSVVERVWEGAQDKSGSAPDSAQQNKILNPERQD